VHFSLPFPFKIKKVKIDRRDACPTGEKRADTRSAPTFEMTESVEKVASPLFWFNGMSPAQIEVI